MGRHEQSTMRRRSIGVDDLLAKPTIGSIGYQSIVLDLSSTKAQGRSYRGAIARRSARFQVFSAKRPFGRPLYFAPKHVGRREMLCKFNICRRHPAVQEQSSSRPYSASRVPIDVKRRMMQDAQWALEVAMNCCVPHQVNERESDMRAVKEGWYAMDESGTLTFGPYSSREDCTNKISRPTRRSMP
jgi:hypothetical protein